MLISLYKPYELSTNGLRVDSAWDDSIVLVTCHFSLFTATVLTA